MDKELIGVREFSKKLGKSTQSIFCYIRWYRSLSDNEKENIPILTMPKLKGKKYLFDKTDYYTYKHFIGWYNSKGYGAMRKFNREKNYKCYKSNKERGYRL